MRGEEVSSGLNGTFTIAFEDIGTIFTSHVAYNLSVSALKSVTTIHTNREIVTDGEPSLEALEDRPIRT